MSEFGAIITLIADVVTWVLIRTLDICALTCLIGAYALPWRWFEIEDPFGRDWHIGAVAELALTIFDCVAVPMTLFSFISPQRWPSFSYLRTEYNRHSDRGDLWDSRFHGCYNFFLCLIELTTLPLGIIAMFLPLRSKLVCTGTSSYIHTMRNPHLIDDIEDYNKTSFNMNKLWFTQFFHGLLDFLFIVPGLTALCCCPSLWYSFGHAMKYQWSTLQKYIPLYLAPPQEPSNDIAAVGHIWQPPVSYAQKARYFANIKRHIKETDETLFDIGMICLVQLPFLLIDAICLPFGVLGLISPLRAGAFLSTIKPCFYSPVAVAEVEAPSGTNTDPDANNKNTSGDAGADGDGGDDRFAAAVENASQLPEERKEEEHADVDTAYDSDLQMALQLSLEAAERRNIAGNASTGAFSKYEVPVAPLFYDFFLRKQCFYFGLTALIDVLLIPVLVPLIVTQYRLRPLWTHLFGASKENAQSLRENGATENEENAEYASRRVTTLWGLDEYMLVSSQFLLLLLDVVFLLPLGLPLYLTQWRWTPIRPLLKKPIVWVDWDLTWELYLMLLRQAFLLLMDLLILPFILLVAICGPHRFDVITAEIADTASWNDSTLFRRNGAMWFHYAVLVNAAVTVHDMVFMLPISLFLLVTVYRAENLLHMIRYFWWESTVLQKEEKLRQELDRLHSISTQTTADRALTASIAEAEARGADGDTSAQRDIQKGQQRRAYLLQNSSACSYARNIWPISCVRSDIWYEFLMMLVDLPPAVLALVVFLTGWRTGHLYTGLTTLHTAYSDYQQSRRAYIQQHAAYISPYDVRFRRGSDTWYNDDIAMTQSRLMHTGEYFYYSNFRYVKKKYESSRRACIYTQFSLLLRDILCLVPFAFVMATIYRLPGLIFDLWLKVKATWTARNQDPGSLSGESVGTSEPLYTVSAAAMSYPELGGPKLYLTLTKNPAAVVTTDNGLTDVRILCNSDDEKGRSSTKSNTAKLFVNIEQEAASFWGAVSTVLGSVLCSVARSMLPLELEADKDINLVEISRHYNNDNTSISNNSNNSSGSGSGSDPVHAWIQLDFGTTKRTTVIKKLTRILAQKNSADNSSDWRLLLQVDTTCQCKSVIAGDSVAPTGGTAITATTSGESAVAVKSLPLFVFCPTVRQLLAMITVANTGLSETVGMGAVSAVAAATAPLQSPQQQVTFALHPLNCSSNISSNNRRISTDSMENRASVTEVDSAATSGVTGTVVGAAGSDNNRVQVVTFAPDALGRQAVQSSAHVHTLATSSNSQVNLFTRNYNTRKQDIHDICEGGGGLVNSFWILTCIAALDALTDLLYCLMALFILSCPWRGVQLLVAICEPVNRWSWRIGSKCVGMLQHADNYMLKYRAGYSMLCNKHAKTILYEPSWGQSYAFNAHRQATEGQYKHPIAAHIDSYNWNSFGNNNYGNYNITGTSKTQSIAGISDAFVAHMKSQLHPDDDYYYNDRYDRYGRNDNDDFVLGGGDQKIAMKGLERLEKEAMHPYQKILTKVIKVLDKQEGCGELLNLVTRRVILQEALLRLWAFKTLINVEFIYADIEASNGTRAARDAYFSTFSVDAEVQRRINQRAAAALPNLASALSTEAVDRAKQKLRADMLTNQQRNVFSTLNSDTKGAILGMVWHQHRSICAELGVNKRQINTAVDAMQRHFEEEDAIQATRITTLKPGFKRARKWINMNSGLLSRSREETHKAIKQFFIQTLTDIGFMFILLFIVATVVRFIPLVMELYQNRAFNIMRFTTKSIIVKHARGVSHDLQQYGTFIGYTLLITITAIGLPAYLTRLPRHMHSMTALIALAKHQFRKTLWYICELLSLFTVWKTYKILVTSVLYSVLVPAACLGEVVAVLSSVVSTTITSTSAAGLGISSVQSLYTRSDNAKFNFYVGIVLFYGLFTLAVIMTVSLYNAADDSLAAPANSSSSNSTTYDAAYSAQFVTGVVLLGYLIISTLIVSQHRKYWVPASTLSPSNISSRTFSWSQLLALLTPLFETVQLCAVLVFFFWDNTNVDISGSSSGSSSSPSADSASATNNRLFISSLLQWDSGTSGYISSMTAAVVCGLASALLISVPLAVGTSSDKAMQRWQSITTSPAFDTLNSLLLRLFSVWIMATLFRPSGCSEVGTIASSGAAATYYLSTSPSVLCGGFTGGNTNTNEHWSSIVSLPLLCYIMIANTILHADSVELNKSDHSNLNTASSPYNTVNNRRGGAATTNSLSTDDTAGLHISESFVKFAPLYTIVMRVFEYSVVLLCFIGSNEANTMYPLSLIATVSVGMVVWSLYWQYRGGACSLVAFSPLRTAGVLCVLWCCILCIIRNSIAITNSADINQTHTSTGNGSDVASATGLYIGWAIIASCGILTSIYQQHIEHSRWVKILTNSGITEAMETLAAVSSTLLVDDVVSIASVAHATGTEDAVGITTTDSVGSRANRRNGHRDGGDASLLSSPSSSAASRRKDRYVAFIQQNFTNASIVSSVPLLAHSALKLEEILLVDRLSIQFLQNRQKWRQLLSVLYANDGLASLSSADFNFLSHGTMTTTTTSAPNNNSRGTKTHIHSNGYSNGVENPNEVTISVPVGSFDTSDPSIIRMRIEEGASTEEREREAVLREVTLLSQMEEGCGGESGVSSSAGNASTNITAAVAARPTNDQCLVTVHKNSLLFALYVLKTRIQALQEGITSASSSTNVNNVLVTRHVLEGLFARKIPLEIIYEIYEYCFDVLPVKAAVTPILSCYDIRFSDVSLTRTWSLGLGYTYPQPTTARSAAVEDINSHNIILDNVADVGVGANMGVDAIVGGSNGIDTELPVVQFISYASIGRGGGGIASVRSHMLNMFSDAVYNIGRLKVHLAEVNIPQKKTASNNRETSGRLLDTRVIDAVLREHTEKNKAQEDHR